MVDIIGLENGQKKRIHLTADAGAGNPVGTIIPMYKKSSPSGYLYCDGSTFDQTKYPALYQYLGSNVLPDYRECVAVGAEQNTTDTIATHDVYTEGQFKDDQLQEHNHQEWATDYQAATQASGLIASTSTPTYRVEKNWNVLNARTGTTTHGKQKAVFIYIKATSGLTENQQENVLNTINENNSYSTEEHPTGKKWIDGKKIYSKTIDCGALPNSTSKNVAHNIANIDKIININGFAKGSDTISLPYVSLASLTRNVQIYADSTNVNIATGIDRTDYTTSYVTLEYTKTTDN